MNGMKAISIRAPWWWFILHAGKDIENRDWFTTYRGTVLIHASKWFSAQQVKDEFYDARDFMLPEGAIMPPVTLGDLRRFGGHIVGSVELVDCVKKSDSPWFVGAYGFVLRNPVAFAKPYPVKGALGFFEAPTPDQAMVGSGPVMSQP